MAALGHTYEIIVGCHYDVYLRGYLNGHGGSKGFLDYLVLPLLARKLVGDYFLPENRNSTAINILRLAIALPLEFARIATGIALTIALTPVVVFAHIIKRFLGWPNEPGAPGAAGAAAFMAEIFSVSLAREPLYQTFIIPSVPQALLPVAEITQGANAKLVDACGLTDIPREYECPLSREVMTDPVYVRAHPNQKFERAWIEQALLIKPLNPLNREPLLVSDLVTDTDLKNKIERCLNQMARNSVSVSMK